MNELSEYRGPLDKSDLETHTWIKIRKHLEERLVQLRLRNDSLTLDEAKTIALRAQIKEVKEMLQWSELKPFMVEPNTETNP